MERVVSPEERMRRAEEIYYRRKAQGVRVSTATVNVGKKNKVSLGKKMIIQILICIAIYSMFWMIKGYNSVFSENVINQTREILSYDINFLKVYNQAKEYFEINFNSIIKKEDNVSDGNVQEDNQENGDVNSNVNGEEQQENSSNNSSNTENNEEVENKQGSVTEDQGNSENSEDSQNEGVGIIEDNAQNVENDGTIKAKQDAENKDQMQQDADFVKQNYSIIKPVEGAITSTFGGREETEIISAFHQGIDIGANNGTAIHAAMEGTVVASSFAGEYGNHIKVQNGEILTVYAHCSELEVNVGDSITQGQEIGKVGATGKATGPHLHFEIRREGRYIDPQLILQF